MTYEPPEHLAIVNHVPEIVPDKDVAFWADAINQQIKEAARLWDMSPMAVSFYGSANRIPKGLAAILAIVRDDGNASSLGYHTAITDFVYGLSEARSGSVTLSHEALEIYGNAYLDRLADGPRGRRYWMELCDACQQDHAYIEADIAGVKKQVKVCDFLLPAWFGLENPADQPKTRTTWRDQPLSPFEIAPGGYQIVQDQNDRTMFLASEMGHAFAMRPTEHSRTNRIRMRQR